MEVFFFFFWKKGETQANPDRVENWGFELGFCDSSLVFFFFVLNY